MDEMFLEIENIASTAANTIASPNWADILSVLFSFLAIIVAGIVAWKQNKISKQQSDIAEQQNKIAVFDKRYELYDIVSKCIALSDNLSTLFGGKVISTENVHLIFAITFKEPSDCIENISAFVEVSNIYSKLNQAEFLFSKNVSDSLSNLSSNLFRLILANAPANQNISLSELVEDYHQTIKNLKTDGILQEIKKDLFLIK